MVHCKGFYFCATRIIIGGHRYRHCATTVVLSWCNVGPTAATIVGATLFCSLGQRCTNQHCPNHQPTFPTISQRCPNHLPTLPQPSANVAPTISQRCPNHQPTLSQPSANVVPTICQRYPNHILVYSQPSKN